MARVTFVLAEKQFLKAASDPHLKGCVRWTGKPPGENPLKLSVLKMEILLFPKLHVCEPVSFNATLAVPPWPCRYPPCALARRVGIGSGSSVCDELVWTLLAAAELLLGTEDGLCRLSCVVPPAEHLHFGRSCVSSGVVGVETLFLIPGLGFECCWITF